MFSSSADTTSALCSPRLAVVNISTWAFRAVNSASETVIADLRREFGWARVNRPGRTPGDSARRVGPQGGGAWAHTRRRRVGPLGFEWPLGRRVRGPMIFPLRRNLN